MAAVSDFLDEVVLGASSADGPVQAWDVRTGMQLKAYKCVPARRSPVPTGHSFPDGRLGARARRGRPMDSFDGLTRNPPPTSHAPVTRHQDHRVRTRGAVPPG